MLIDQVEEEITVRVDETTDTRGDAMRGENEPVQLVCPKCRETIIVYLPIDDLPPCPNPECDGTQMVIEELLDEGKSF